MISSSGEHRTGSSLPTIRKRPGSEQAGPPAMLLGPPGSGKVGGKACDLVCSLPGGLPCCLPLPLLPGFIGFRGHTAPLGGCIPVNKTKFLSSTRSRYTSIPGNAITKHCLRHEPWARPAAPEWNFLSVGEFSAMQSAVELLGDSNWISLFLFIQLQGSTWAAIVHSLEGQGSELITYVLPVNPLPAPMHIVSNT